MTGARHRSAAERRAPGPEPTLARLEQLLGSTSLSARECDELATLAAAVPGRQRHIAAALGRQLHAAAVDGLLRLPSTVPGVVEGLFRAVRAGVRREHAIEESASPDAPTTWTSPAQLALEFRRSRSQQFPSLLRRAQLSFGAGLERLELGLGRRDGQRHDAAVFRVALTGPEGRGDDDPALDRWRPAPTSAPADPALETLAAEFTWLHGQLSRLRGTRLWVNGWCFPYTRVQGEITPAVQVHLVRAWIEWARSAGSRGPRA